MAELIITNLERDEKGFWRCNVTIEDTTAQVHKRHGCWQLDRKDGTVGTVFPHIAARIQEKVRKIEKAERLAN